MAVGAEMGGGAEMGRVSTAVTDAYRAIAKTEPALQAWAWLADCADVTETAGSTGMLAGQPVGIKDIIDVAGWPCCYGSALFADNIAATDAELVTRLRAAGAVILGKTVTTEFAYMQISKTRNPHNSRFSPGGSSSGSAAAVAAGHLRLAVGTQTGGSVIRPASYCGVHAMKPTKDSISRNGVLQTSQTLDQVGLFAASLAETGQLASVLTGNRALASAAATAPARTVRLLYLDRLYGDEVADYVHEGLARIAEQLGSCVDIRPAAPARTAQFLATHKMIYDYEINQNIQPKIAGAAPDQLSAEITQALERGRQISHADYQAALRDRAEAISYFTQLLDGYDALLTASSPAEAPVFEQGTGNSVCNCLWSLCGFPAVSLPLLRSQFQITGPAGLPVGLQLTARPDADAALLRAARWAEAALR